MYKIMYRVNETMRWHMSAVVYSEEATAAAREWFEGQCDSYYIKEV